MRKPEHPQPRRAAAADHDLELLKAAAQAWHAQSGNPKPTEEFHARRSPSDSRPTRFKLEAAATAARAAEPHWDFAESLWDSYEIVTLSKKLEAASISSDDPARSAPDRGQPGKRSREGKNSLRDLFFHRPSSSSKRFDHFNARKTQRYEK
ncbi:hypothetical protein Cni_G20091 [Canna indica]|uniref:Uncharacterized protein n=1 Tax=Canna indica TaxID=4628 RepID=A0AAQ3KN82_9LILI|nr:hypothetical protein Cni_G20091 [Canna indica]